MTEIGSGGGGTVYKAYHVQMKKDVVLKKIHQCLQTSTDIRSELDILKNLRHTYLPTVLDFIEDNGAIYTVVFYDTTVYSEDYKNGMGNPTSTAEYYEYSLQDLYNDKFCSVYAKMAFVLEEKDGRSNIKKYIKDTNI